MDRLAQDLRLAYRRLRQNPGFTLVAVLTLALGIGANTAVFSLLNAVFFRPLTGVRDPARVVSFNQIYGANSFPSLSFPNYRDLRDRNTSFSGVLSYRFLPASLGLPGASRRVWGYLVTGNYFEVLGVEPHRGRLITPDDDRHPGAHPVAVLSYKCWQAQFGGDPRVIGAPVKFNGQTYTLLGVTPPGFFGTELFYTPDVFFPMMQQRALEGGNGYLDNRGSSNTFVAGRLKNGVTPEQASAELASLARRLAEEWPKDNEGMKITLSPPGLAGNYLRGAVIGFAAALFGVSALVLLIACTNLAGMLLARAADRRKDTAIRLAIGAGRATLIRQLLTENLVMALFGGAGGALVALWITDAVASWHPPVEIPLTIAVQPDVRVFLFAFLIAAVTALVFGLAPAMQASRVNLVPALKNEAGGERVRRWHLRDYMVALQICLSAVLLVSSVLVVRSLQRALEAPIGFNPNGAVKVSYDLNVQGYKEEQGRVFHRRLLDAVRAIPGVQSAAIIDALPLSLNSSNNGVMVEGKPEPKATEVPMAHTYTVSPDYFRTMQTRILSGREFDERDTREKVAVVNLALAQKYIPGENPIGKRFKTGPKGNLIEIVGVCEDGKYFSLNEDREPAFFTPHELYYPSNATLVVRSPLAETEVLKRVQAVFRDLDPGLALFEQGTLARHLDLPLFPARLAAAALGGFGVLVLLLAATGIYGVMAYAVSRRTREIGIRMAIGALPRQVLSALGRGALLLVGCGSIAGLALAFFAARLLKQILYGVEPTDPATFGIVALLLAVIAAAGCWIPARRATRIDPLKALRQE